MEVIKINNKLDFVDKENIKVRLLSIKDGELVVANYADLFMLPGGKIDKGESLIDALLREVYEEVGFNIDLDRVEELAVVDNYQSNYPSDGKLINKYTKTYYYVTDELLPMDKKQSLSEREKEFNFHLLRININELVDILENKCNGVKETSFSLELLQVLNVYLKRYGLIDLHTHTNLSDGDSNPDKVLSDAIRQYIKVIALTDHDTIKGIKSVDKSKYPELEIINGIELSAKVPVGRLHILGYGIDLDNQELNDGVEKLRLNNINTMLELIKQLEIDFGIKFSNEDIEEMIENNNNLGRPHVARLLINYGYVQTVQEAFDKYLVYSYDKLGDRKKGLPYSECIKLIINAGGIPVLAHPHTLKMNRVELEEFLQELIDLGLKGIEVYHSNISYEDRLFYLELADKYNLFITGGTDYHGKTVKPDIELGRGRNGNVYVPHNLKILSKIKTS